MNYELKLCGTETQMEMIFLITVSSSHHPKKISAPPTQLRVSKQ
jgi:hypothetical protein